VVDLAKETIRFLAHLNNHTNLYRRIQVFYHQFLTSAIAVLFLASTHAPLRFSASCRYEFYQAVDLIKDMSGRSFVSQRLWRTVKSLKRYAPRLGLEDQRQPTDPLSLSHMLHSSQSPGSGLGVPYSGGVSRAGSRGPQLHSSASTPTAHAQQPTDDHDNGLHLHTEMQRIFEGYMQNGIPSAAVSPLPTGLAHIVSPGHDGGFGGNIDSTPTGGVYQHIKDMF